MTQTKIAAALRSRRYAELARRACALREQTSGRQVFIRGLIEFSNVCCRNCLYCGLRRDNLALPRYRMTEDEILAAVHAIAERGIGTAILQSGDDLGYSRRTICSIVTRIRREVPGIAVTLSVGERPPDDYAAFRDAGVDRYLMKHESASERLYTALHPGQSFATRMGILECLKKLGFQVGCGCIVGVPGQRPADLVEDILFIQRFQPDMAGIGPFVPQRDTPLGTLPHGSIRLVLKMLSLARLVSPGTLLPATTALETASGQGGQIAALRAGANVIMVNFTPDRFRKNYRIYDHKARISLETAGESVRAAGLVVSLARGDSYLTRSPI